MFPHKVFAISGMPLATLTQCPFNSPPSFNLNFRCIIARNIQRLNEPQTFFGDTNSLGIFNCQMRCHIVCVNYFRDIFYGRELFPDSFFFAHYSCEFAHRGEARNWRRVKSVTKPTAKFYDSFFCIYLFSFFPFATKI